MRRGQVENQIFIYLMTVLVIGFLLFFGIRWFGGLIKQEDLIQELQFKSALENAFDRQRSNYGSSAPKEFIAPGTGRVCFVDTQIGLNARPFKGLCVQSHADYDPYMCNDWKDNVSAVVAWPPLSVEINIGAVELPEPNYVCFDTVSTKRIKVTLVGLGNRVRIVEE